MIGQAWRPTGPSGVCRGSRSCTVQVPQSSVGCVNDSSGAPPFSQDAGSSCVSILWRFIFLNWHDVKEFTSGSVLTCAVVDRKYKNVTGVKSAQVIKALYYFHAARKCMGAAFFCSRGHGRIHQLTSSELFKLFSVEQMSSVSHVQRFSSAVLLQTRPKLTTER